MAKNIEDEMEVRSRIQGFRERGVGVQILRQAVYWGICWMLACRNQ